MKIAFYTTAFFPYICGVGTSVFNLSLGLLRNGHEITLCIPKTNCSILRNLAKKGVKIVFLPSFQTKLFKDFNIGAPSAKSFLAIKKINPDLIHFHTPEMVGLEAVLSAKILKKPLVGTFHTYIMSPEYQKIIITGVMGEEFIEKILWKYNNSIYNRCDLIISPSKFSKEDLIRNGIKKPIKVLHNSIDLKNLTINDKNEQLALKRKYHLSEKTVLYVGRLSREKSLDLLILAFNVVIRKVPEAKLLIVGDGPVKTELQALIGALNLQKSVIFTGQVSNENLIKNGYHKVATLFATASASEVQPMSVIEAMGFGLPIVGFKMRGMIELVKGNGIVCKPADVSGLSQALVKILTSNSLQKKYSLQSKKIAQKEYALDKICNEMEIIYQKLIDKD